MSDDTDTGTDTGGTVRYHRAEYHDGPIYPWRIQYFEDAPWRYLSAAEAEAMGLTPPPPPEPDWDDLPVGSEVESGAGNKWVRFHDGWGNTIYGIRHPTLLAENAPYTVTYRHEPEVTLEAALRRIGYSDADIRDHANELLASAYLRTACRQVVAEWEGR